MGDQLNLTSGNPAEWPHDVLPSRDEALMLAVRAASAAGSPMIPAAAGEVYAAQSRAWSAVAAQLPDLERFGFGGDAA